MVSYSNFKNNIFLQYYPFLDYEWMARIAKGLWSLGEFAFRELLMFFEKIDTRSLRGAASFANSINVRFSCAILSMFLTVRFIPQTSAIYLRGKHDIFFYEFLYEVCGDKLLPFLLYYASKGTN